MRTLVFFMVAGLVLGSCTLRPELDGSNNANNNGGNNGGGNNGGGNAGGITLIYDGPSIQTGKLLTFSWNSQTSANFVRLDIFRNNLFETMLLDYAPNAGSYTWLIPAILALADSDMFSAKLTVYNAAVNPQIIQELQSAPFQIKQVAGGGSGLSDVIVNAASVSLTLTDNGALVDGDRVSLTLNGIVIQPDLSLVGAPGTVVNANLVSGMNTLVVTALNEGTSPPNTAEFAISSVVSGSATQQWRLNTGQSGTVKIYRQP